MKHKTTKYATGPIDKVKVLDDFLPAPEELVLKEKTKKVTINANSEIEEQVAILG